MVLFQLDLMRFILARLRKTPSSEGRHRVWLIYDPACSLCERLKDAVVAMDRRSWVTPLSLHDPRVHSLLPPESIRSGAENFHMVSFSGRVRTGAEAIPDILRLLPGGGIAAWGLEHAPGGRCVTRWLYRALASFHSPA